MHLATRLNRYTPSWMEDACACTRRPHGFIADSSLQGSVQIGRGTVTPTQLSFLAPPTQKAPAGRMLSAGTPGPLPVRPSWRGDGICPGYHAFFVRAQGARTDSRCSAS